MAKRVVWTETAWIDLETVADFIARDSPYYAASFVREIRDYARSLSRMAMRGRIVPEIGDKQIRELIIQSYRLIYRVEPSLSAYSAFLWRSMYHQGHEGHEEKQFKHKDLRVENQKNPSPSWASRSSW